MVLTSCWHLIFRFCKYRNRFTHGYASTRLNGKRNLRKEYYRKKSPIILTKFYWYRCKQIHWSNQSISFTSRTESMRRLAMSLDNHGFTRKVKKVFKEVHRASVTLLMYLGSLNLESWKCALVLKFIIMCLGFYNLYPRCNSSDPGLYGVSCSRNSLFYRKESHFCFAREHIWYPPLIFPF